MSQSANVQTDLSHPTHAFDLIEVQPGGVVSRTILKKKTGTVTVFAFDAGEGLSEHTTPFDALIMSMDGDAEITISGKSQIMKTGDIQKLPAGDPHAVKALTPLRMLLIMIRE